MADETSPVFDHQDAKEQIRLKTIQYVTAGRLEEGVTPEGVPPTVAGVPRSRRGRWASSRTE